MGKVVSIFIALSVAITIIVPDIDIKAYFVNLLENFPQLLPVFSNSTELWNNVLTSIQNGGTFTDFLTTLEFVFKFIVEFLIVAPARLLYWLIQALIVIFGGAI